ncbi:MAG TPA: LysM peptidoglycan-binding domain-containing protein [Nitrospirota bacterium]|nr:LysM peptidoglycan-binding domain-containing protein [Nitrospirota bacterium]
MTSRSTTLIQAAGIFFIFMFFPGAAYLQEQKESQVTEPQQEVTTTEPSQQESGQLITPQDETSAGLEDMQQEQGLQNVKEEPVEPQSLARKPAQEISRQYTIRKGDTLWDISSAYLKDPFLWPFIWKANPSIVNPDLIYPGNLLALPSLTPIERALKSSAEAEPKKTLVEKKLEEEQTPQQPATQLSESLKTKPIPSAITEETSIIRSSLVVPEEQPTPIIDKYAMLRAGFVNAEDAYGTIVGSSETAKTIFSFGDIVFVKFSSAQNVHIGDKFLIYSILHKVNNPITGNKSGNLIKGLGILQITAMDTPAVLTAQITLSFDAIEKDNLLIPYQEPALIFNSPQRKDKDISGYILEVTDDRRVNGQLDFVYLDRGSAEGVELGDRFNVFRKPDERSFPKILSGEVRVFIVKEHTATALVTKSTNAITRGDQVQFKK